MKTTRVITGLSADSLPIQRLIDEGEPAILKGVAADWPLVRKGLEGARAAIDYLASFDAGQPVVGYTGAPEIGGRFFYNDDLTRLNFEAKRVPFGEFLGRIAEHIGDPDAPSFYIGSTDLSLFLPGLGGDNGLPADLAPFADHKRMAGIWIGNRTVASTHYDFSNNIACSLVGRRRFGSNRAHSLRQPAAGRDCRADAGAGAGGRQAAAADPRGRHQPHGRDHGCARDGILRRRHLR